MLLDDVHKRCVELRRKCSKFFAFLLHGTHKWVMTPLRLSLPPLSLLLLSIAFYFMLWQVVITGSLLLLFLLLLTSYFNPCIFFTPAISPQFKIGTKVTHTIMNCFFCRQEWLNSWKICPCSLGDWPPFPQPSQGQTKYLQLLQDAWLQEDTYFISI